jgi:hypothetical protein
MSKPIILNDDYALIKMPEGWHIYGYIHSEDIPLGCVKDKFAGSVTLNTDAAMILLDAICSELGGCDALKDAYADINDANIRAEVAEAELSNGHKALTAAGVPESDENGRLSICGRVVKLREAAEADAERLAERMRGAEQTIRNLGNAALSGDWATIALNEAVNIRAALAAHDAEAVTTD